MHEASIPADATHLKRGTDAPNDEDGRILQSIAEITDDQDLRTNLARLM